MKIISRLLHFEFMISIQHHLIKIGNNSPEKVYEFNVSYSISDVVIIENYIYFELYK